MTIDFPDKLRSTRRDHKLVDATAIDGLIERSQLTADAAGGVVGLAGLRTESISLQDNGLSTVSSELAPAAADPLALVHPDDGSDLEILSGVSGNDFTVAPGLYFLQAEGELVASQVGRFEIDVRQASDDAIVGGLSPVSFVNTDSAYQGFTTSGYWHVGQAIEVNLFLERYGRNAGVRNLVISFARLTAEDTIDRSYLHPADSPDLDDYSPGDVILSNSEFLEVSEAAGADVFSGVAATWQSGDFTGTAAAQSRYGAQGQFISNPDGVVGALASGGGNADTVGLRLEQSAYEAAKGSAVAAGDEVIAEITVDGSTTRTTLPYVRTETAGDTSYLAFIARDEDSALHDLDAGDRWTMKVLSAYDSNTMTGTSLLTHGAGTKHLVEYPLDGVDRYARDTLIDMVAFFAAVKSWEFVEPSGGIGFREVGRSAGETRDEAITGELDPDRELVAALRITEEYELTRTLRLQGTIGYFLRKTQGITTSGAVGSVQVSLAVQRSGAAVRVLRQLHAASFTLDQFNAQYAAVGNTLQYSDSADVTHAVDESWTDFSNFDLQKGDLLVFHFRANAINGNALVKIEMQDLDITLTKGL